MRDMYGKLPTLLQNQVMLYVDDDSITMETFVLKCQSAAGLIAQQQINR